MIKRASLDLCSEPSWLGNMPVVRIPKWGNKGSEIIGRELFVQDCGNLPLACGTNGLSSLDPHSTINSLIPCPFVFFPNWSFNHNKNKCGNLFYKSVPNPNSQCAIILPLHVITPKEWHYSLNVTFIPIMRMCQGARLYLKGWGNGLLLGLLEWWWLGFLPVQIWSFFPNQLNQQIQSSVTILGCWV